MLERKSIRIFFSGNRRQALSIAVMITVFTPFARFILSSVAEAFLLSIVLVYAGLFCAYRRERKPAYFHALLCLAVFLTIIRPYFCLFILLSEIGLSGKDLRRRFRSACGAVLGLMGYWVMKYWFSAPYLFHHIGGGFLETLQQEVSRLEEQLADSMELSEGLSWNNTVIWLAYDMVDGEYVSEQWQLLYALPAGFGINHCSQDYVLNNFDSIRSRYIAAVPGGEVEKRLTESGAVLLAGNDDISIWDKGRME